jgi:hypothetical protein
MTEGTITDPTHNGTLRPNAPLIPSHGTTFTPMQLDDFDVQLTLPSHVSPTTPFSIFTLYYTPQIIDLIV